MVADIPLEFFKANAFADGFMAMPLEVLMRFGRWDEILAEPPFPEFVPISRALRHYARAVAFAAKDDLASARTEQAAFEAARRAVAKEATFGNNPGADVLGVAESFMRGEILYRAGQVDEGLAALREAAEREDRLRYDEPPDWIQPVRHALGAALLQAGRFAEAEGVFRARPGEAARQRLGALRALAGARAAEEDGRGGGRREAVRRGVEERRPEDQVGVSLSAGRLGSETDAAGTGGLDLYLAPVTR